MNEVICLYNIDKKSYKDFELRNQISISKKRLVSNFDNITTNFILYNYLNILSQEATSLLDSFVFLPN